MGSRQHAPSGPRLQRGNRRALLAAGESAVALHHQEVSPEATLSQLFLQAPEIPYDAWTDKGIHENRVHTSVLTDHARKLMAIRLIQVIAREARFYECADLLLVRWVDPRAQQADR